MVDGLTDEGNETWAASENKDRHIEKQAEIAQ